MANWREILYSVSVEPAMFIYMICLYYLIPALNSLYMYKVCRTVHHFSVDLCTDLVNANFSANDTREHVVSQDSSSWLFYQTIVFTIPSTIVTLLLGLHGDRKGRLLPLLIPFFGQAVGCSYYLLMAKVETLHVSYMLVGAFLTGISGGFASVIMASFSHISTVSSNEYRTIRIVILQVIMGFGTAFGSFTVGSVVSKPNDLVGGWVRTFVIIIVLTVVSIAYILIRFLIVPNATHQYENVTGEEHAPPLVIKRSLNVVKVLSTVCHGFPGVLQLILLAIWFTWIRGLGEFDVLFYYTQRMGLDRSIYGYYTGYGGAAQAIAGAAGVLVFKRMLKISDAVLSIIGQLSACLELLFLGISGFLPGHSIGFQFLWWSSPMVGMFKVLGPASLRSLAASLVQKCDHSKLFAFISASDGLLQLLTSALYNYLLWRYTEEQAPSVSFFVSLALALASVAIIVIIHSILRRREVSDDMNQLEVDLSD